MFVYLFVQSTFNNVTLYNLHQLVIIKWKSFCTLVDCFLITRCQPASN